MKDYWKLLVPFSPDTSGFCSVINGTDGAGVIDDPQGCVTNYLIYEEDRKIPQRVYNSQLCNMDVVFGSEEKLLKRFEEAALPTNPAFALLGGSPISALIGTDLESAAATLEERFSVPSAAVNLTGYLYYHEGVRETYLSLARLLFEREKSEKTIIPDSVNLLGCCPLDIGVSGCEAAEKCARENGQTVLSAWGGTGCSLKDMKNAGSAEKNLVMSADAVPLAEYLREKYGTPWEIWVPFEPEALQKTAFADLPECLIIGEPFVSRGISRVLEKHGLARCLTAGFFPTSPGDYDHPLKEEGDLLSLLREKRWDVVVGDPSFQSVCGKWNGFVPLLHRAVSGLLYTASAPEYPDVAFWSEMYEKLKGTGKQ